MATDPVGPIVAAKTGRLQVTFIDFEVNAVGTLNLLEATRHSASEAVFIFMSTNKVYGDAPNRIKPKEMETHRHYNAHAMVRAFPNVSG